ncbi:MAG: CpXC domain-containing protein [Kiritimatiellae bacterium]|nr:CpXC domain-containing protein [Kiritimatiellia bacterium]
MSSSRQHSIRCPRCRDEFEVELWDAVNLVDRPSARDEVLQNRLNVVKCPTCELSFRVDKPLLYLDPGRGFGIWWAPEGVRDPERVAKEFRLLESQIEQHTGGLPLRLLLVHERRELVERIFIAEAGLDERLVEYVKYLMLSRNPKRLDPARHRLRFAGRPADGGDDVDFVVEDSSTGRLEGVLRYPRAAFNEVERMFGRSPAEALAELFPGPRADAAQLFQDGPDGEAAEQRQS